MVKKSENNKKESIEKNENKIESKKKSEVKETESTIKETKSETKLEVKPEVKETKLEVKPETKLDVKKNKKVKLAINPEVEAKTEIDNSITDLKIMEKGSIKEVKKNKKVKLAINPEIEDKTEIDNSITDLKIIEKDSIKEGSKKKSTTVKKSKKLVIKKKVIKPKKVKELIVDDPTKLRSFKCEFDGVIFGRYKGRKPKQAASKALTKIVKISGGNKKCIGTSFTFKMIESSRARKKKVSFYEGSRVELVNPKTIEKTFKDKNGNSEIKQIEYFYNNKIKKIKNIDPKKLLQENEEHDEDDEEDEERVIKTIV
jgi:hypothetical protein